MCIREQIDNQKTDVVIINLLSVIIPTQTILACLEHIPAYTRNPLAYPQQIQFFYASFLVYAF